MRTDWFFFTSSVAVEAVDSRFSPTEEDLMMIDEKCVEAGKTVGHSLHDVFAAL